MKSFFVGDNAKPSFLVEIAPDKKLLYIYKPDKYSKNEDFYEKYALGKLLVNIKYNEIIYVKKPVAYKGFLFVPEIIFKINNNNIVVSKKITETAFVA